MAEITFCGETFEIPEQIGAMPLMRFAALARSGVDSGDLEGLAAMYTLMRSCIAEDDWQRFEELADSEHSGADELWLVVQDVFRVHAERPTERPSDSSAGPGTTSPSSAGDSSSRVIGRLEGQGRPDLALVVKQTQEYLAG